jgi:MFS family permease
MTSLAGSAQLVALVATATLMPVLLFSLPFGAMADIYDRRKVLIAAQLIMFSASSLLSLAAFMGMITPTLLLLLTFVIGLGFALNSPAWQAAVREFVPNEELAGAISLNISASRWRARLARRLAD